MICKKRWMIGTEIKRERERERERERGAGREKKYIYIYDNDDDDSRLKIILTWLLISCLTMRERLF